MKHMSYKTCLAMLTGLHFTYSLNFQMTWITRLLRSRVRWIVPALTTKQPHCVQC